MNPKDQADDDRCQRRGCPKKASHGGRGWCRPHYQQRLTLGLAGFVDSAPTIAHLEALREAGWTFSQIGEASGLHPTVPAVLMRRRYGRVRKHTADALRAVPVVKQASRRSVESTGSRRRLQALAWMGWSLDEIARRAGMTKSLLVTVYRPRVSHAVARQVEQVYEQLSGVWGPSKAAAAKARANGHAPPLAWDDDTIDDPDAVPDLGPQRARTRQDIAEDAVFLARTGMSTHGIAARLRVSEPYVRGLLNGQARRAA